MVNRTIRKLVIAPLMLLAVMFGYSQDAAANGPYNINHNQRHGGTEFRRLENMPNAAQCRQACALEAECRSWNYYSHGTLDRARANPEVFSRTCFLMSNISRPHYDTCCSSGIKPPPPAVKAGRDRPPPHVEGMARADPPPPVVKR